MAVKTPTFDLCEHYDKHLLCLWRHAPFVLRITERKDRPIPVLIVKERQSVHESNGQAPTMHGLLDHPPQGNLVELGRLDGAALRRCLPILRQIVGRVRNAHDIPVELQRYLTQEGLKLRLNLPLDEGQNEVLDGFIFARQVTCPNCGGEAPLLNTCWLSKEAGEQWGVRVVTDGQARGGNVSFQTYRVVKGHGPHGEDPDQATVNRGIGQCVHCKQAISAEEIKAQARGESPHGRWTDRLYCVVAVRLEPKLDRRGKPQCYASGPRKGEIKTRKVRFFRAPNARDVQALKDAETRLQERWSEWEAAGLIPTEGIPIGAKTGDPDVPSKGTDLPRKRGENRWIDMFTPRQLLGHLTLIEEFNRLKPEILHELGPERGRAEQS